MSLFIAALAFPSPALVEEAKVGILLGSTVAGAAGWLILRRAPEEETVHMVASASEVAP
jgi:NhaA family Na+:H+ antiporter